MNYVPDIASRPIKYTATLCSVGVQPTVYIITQSTMLAMK